MHHLSPRSGGLVAGTYRFKSSTQLLHPGHTEQTEMFNMTGYGIERLSGLRSPGVYQLVRHTADVVFSGFITVQLHSYELHSTSYAQLERYLHLTQHRMTIRRPPPASVLRLRSELRLLRSCYRYIWSLLHRSLMAPQGSFRRGCWL